MPGASIPHSCAIADEYFRALQSVSSYVLDGSSRLQLIYNNGPLDSNPTTGYGWQVSQVNSAVLEQHGEPQFIRPADAPLGAGGVRVFRFTAAAGGATSLALVYKRSFEPDAAPAQTFTVQVTVQ